MLEKPFVQFFVKIAANGGRLNLKIFACSPGLKVILGEPEKCVERCRTSYNFNTVPNSVPGSEGDIHFTQVTSIDECRQICIDLGTVAFGLECPHSDPNGENFQVHCFCYNQAAWDGFSGEAELPIEDCQGIPSNNLLHTYHGHQGTNSDCNGPYFENEKGLGGACRNMIRLTSPANCPSNCWNDDGRGNCVLSDSAECQSTVTCSPFEMDIKLPSDLFGDNFEFDGDQGCHPTLQNEEYVYTGPLGNCGVELSREQNANGDDIITFKKDITAIVPDADQSSQTVDGITFFTNIAATSYTVSFSCSFPATFSTSSASVAVGVDPAHLGDAGTVTAATDETSTWDGSFELEFFTSDNFLTKREQTCPATFPHSYLNGEKCCSVTTSDCSDGESFDCPETTCSNFDAVNGGIIVGQEQFIQTAWNISGLENKLRYYIDECFVTDEGAGTSLHIVKGSCYAGMIGAEALGSASSQSKVVQSSSQFKFTAFTFDALSKANSQTLTCSLKFCIWNESNSSSDCHVAEVDGSGTGVCPTDAGYDYRA